MLPIVLVLFVATSALAAPRVQLNAVSINDVVPPKHNGGLISAYWTDQASEIADAGETSAYILTAQQVINDLANRSDRSSQALAAAQAIGLLGTLSTGIPGDACAAAEVIDEYVRAIRSGNQAGIRAAVLRFIQSLSSTIDRIVLLATNPDSQRYASGPRGNCYQGGRKYLFEEAWDLILANTSPSAAELVNEQYCSAKRLHQGFFSHSNNAGAYITAASLPPVNVVFQKAFEPVARFVASIASGNPRSAAAAAKSALINAAKN